MPSEGINPWELPEHLEPLWAHFNWLNKARHSGMEPGPILESEILAYCLNRRMEFEVWEMETLRILDQVALGRITFEEELNDS